jgi:hypothetical protein
MISIPVSLNRLLLVTSFLAEQCIYSRTPINGLSLLNGHIPPVPLISLIKNTVSLTMKARYVRLL